MCKNDLKYNFVGFITHLQLADVTAWELLRRVTWVIRGWTAPPRTRLVGERQRLTFPVNRQRPIGGGQRLGPPSARCRARPPGAQLVDSRDWLGGGGKSILIGQRGEASRRRASQAPSACSVV